MRARFAELSQSIRKYSPDVDAAAGGRKSPRVVACTPPVPWMDRDPTWARGAVATSGLIALIAVTT